MRFTRRDALCTLAAATLPGTAGCSERSPDGDPPDYDDPGRDGAPEVLAVSTATVESSCLDPPDPGVDVDLGERVVEVTGVVSAPNPCYGVVASATVEDETLAVDVGVEPERAEDCIQCSGSLEYEVTVELSGDGVDGVDVAHADDGLQASVDADGDSGER